MKERNLRNKKGFTLIEVIVVLVILTILIAIAVPSVMKYIDDANEAKYLAEARAVYVTAEAEIVKDYAPDKTYEVGADATKLTDAVNKALSNNPEVTSVTAYTDDFKTQLAGNVAPNEIKAYAIKLKGLTGKTVQIKVNGGSKIIDDTTN